MTGDERNLGTPPDRVVERGRTYDHPSHGRVEVTGIWQGTRWVDEAPVPAERGRSDPIVVRYVPAPGDDWTDELAATLDDFRDAIDR